jgi:hypothetical protein
MDLASSSPRPAGFLSELLSIVQDRQVVALAVRWSADHELAEDALQTAYCQVATAPHPEAIVNLRAYFLWTLKNEITSTYSVRRPVPVDDLEAVTPPQPSTTLYGRAPERAVADQACATAQTQVWVNRHAARHDELIAKVPARSTDRARYREVIYAAAKQAFLGHLSLEPNDPAFPEVLKEVYPGYFDDPAVAPNTLHQRLSRARDDITAVLPKTIKREELF